MKLEYIFNSSANEGAIKIKDISKEKFDQLCKMLDIASKDESLQKNIKIIIAGSRSFTNYLKLCKEINAYISHLQQLTGLKLNITIISGTAKGADTLGEVYARRHGYICRRMPAQWNIYGKSAGIIRNGQMARFANSDAHGVLFAFWDGKSPGTLNMIDEAKKENLEIHIIRF